MKNKTNRQAPTLVVLALLYFPLVSLAQENNANTVFGRKYTPSEVYRYRLTTWSWLNGNLTSKLSLSP